MNEVIRQVLDSKDLPIITLLQYEWIPFYCILKICFVVSNRFLQESNESFLNVWLK